MKRAAGTFDIELGRRLKRARLEKGFSRQTVGESLGVTAQQVQKYEQGSNRLSVAFLVRLRALYDVPLGHLIPGNGRAFPVPKLGRQAARLVGHFEAIRCEKVRGHLAALVRNLAVGRRTEADRTRRGSPPDPAGSP